MSETKNLRGFASMDPARQRQIASKGGKAAHKKGTGHEWTGGSDGTAAKAGRRGGMVSRGGRGAQKPGADADSVDRPETP